MLPIGAIGIAVAFLAVMYVTKPEPEKKEPTRVLPTVEVYRVEAEPIRLSVRTQGTVVPKTETVLTAEVSGPIIMVSPNFVDGGFFKKGEVLLQIDPVEYEAALAASEARVAQARLALAQEEALSAQARQDWEDLGRGEPNDLVLRKPQMLNAKAEIEAAQANLAVAKRNLDKTKIRAPYDGRVRIKMVDIGQAVSARASQLAQVYSVDVAEVRLPVTAEQTAFFELPELYEGERSERYNPTVYLSATYGGERHIWEGSLDRTEGVIDTRSRMTYVVAKVDKPYARTNDGAKPPLKVGLFVEAEIEGNFIPEAFRIPRSTLQDGNLVYVLDQNNRLRAREVSIVKTDSSEAIVGAGLKTGDQICLTPLTFFIDGMEVIPVDESGTIRETIPTTGTELEVAEVEQEGDDSI